MMFRDARKLTAAGIARSFNSLMRRYSASSEKWYDGSVDSIDRRLTLVGKALHQAATAVSALPLGQVAPYLTQLRRLQADRTALEELRYTLLTGAADHRPDDPISSPATVFDDDESVGQDVLDREGRDPDQDRLAGMDRRWVNLESVKFIAGNTDTLHDPHEMTARAREHAEMKTSTFTPARSAAITRAFVASVERHRSSRYRHQPRRRVTAAIRDFADELMYLG